MLDALIRKALLGVTAVLLAAVAWQAVDLWLTKRKMRSTEQAAIAAQAQAAGLQRGLDALESLNARIEARTTVYHRNVRDVLDLPESRLCVDSPPVRLALERLQQGYSDADRSSLDALVQASAGTAG